MGRAPCCDKATVKKGAWSPEEDDILKDYIHKHGNGGNWIALPRRAGLKRCGKSCRLRWLNYLRPDIKHGGFTEEEDDIICTLYRTLGSRWSVIASKLPGRTDNDVKNYWNTKLKKKLLSSGRIAQSSSGAISSHIQDKAAVSASLSSPQSYLHETSVFNYPKDSLSMSLSFQQSYDPKEVNLEFQSGYVLPSVMEISGFGTSSGSNNYNISQGQDQISTVSTSSSANFGADINGYGGWYSNGGAEEDEFPMNFSFETCHDDDFLEEFSFHGLIMDNIA